MTWGCQSKGLFDSKKKTKALEQNALVRLIFLFFPFTRGKKEEEEKENKENKSESLLIEEEDSSIPSLIRLKPTR
jgi:hypothetical protein